MSCNQVNARKGLISSFYEVDLESEFSRKTTQDMSYHNQYDN